MLDNLPNDPWLVNLDPNVPPCPDVSSCMSRYRPPFPDGRPPHFRATVHGIAFADRDRHLEALEAGDSLYLIPDLPDQETPGGLGASPGRRPPRPPPDRDQCVAGAMAVRGRGRQREGSEDPRFGGPQLAETTSRGVMLALAACSA